LKIIKGFSLAKSALSRPVTTEPYPLSPSIRQGLTKIFGTDNPEKAVKQIIDEVRSQGDTALVNYTSKLDGVKLTSLEVSKKQIASAFDNVDSELISALKLASERIRSFHIAQRKNAWHELKKNDLVQLIRPLERIGVYAPGGTASYPSTVLMTAIPARVAGVKEVILVTPPREQGSIPPPTLVAADIAQVDRVFSIGGAQAIAALAYGTRTIPKVDKVCGPGNIFVTLAKKLVYGTVDIDGLQGPSEVLIIADDKANPEYCAADLLAQAEHDPLAVIILITTSFRLAEEVNKEVGEQLQELARQTIAAQSLASTGKIIVVGKIEEAIELANHFAPEHLSLMLSKADDYIDKIKNAGCVFIGESSPVVLGDYMAGPSHALPTGGTAKFSSPLNITDFIKFIDLIKINKKGFKQLGPAAATIARAEGLEAHAKAVEKRLKAWYNHLTRDAGT
jgi:histidinol dehydrogenase